MTLTNRLVMRSLGGERVQRRIERCVGTITDCEAQLEATEKTLQNTDTSVNKMDGYQWPDITEYRCTAAHHHEVYAKHSKYNNQRLSTQCYCD